MHSKNINLPSKPKIISESGNKGVYEIDGLYPGYGYTLGNSMRRIIISSIPGAAITSLSIKGVKHEFSTIDGVKEDVISIILNLKNINFTLHSDEPQKLTLKAKGPKTVTAKDFDKNAEVDIVNADTYICEITGKVEFEMEITVEKGIGYISKETVEKERTEIGTIALDAPFTPVRRVSYEVENMRVGDRTDHNRLRLAIETDGSITPKKVLEYSIEIMIKQLQAIVGFKENLNEVENGMMSDDMAEVEMDTAPTPNKVKIEDLQFSTRTENALLANGIKTLAGLLKKTPNDLKAMDGLGEKAVEEIKELLEGKGLALKEDKE